ncbi:MAG: DinB family protein [Candidatus Kapabacteria bacterium]|nr:DinB family protein [Candidatus Kapabacteria bacterium]
MYSSVSDFLAQYKHESQSTAKLIAAISDTNFNNEPSPKVRSTGRMAWHIARAIGGLAGSLNINATHYSEDQKPGTAAEVLALYNAASSELLAGVEANITNDMLGNEVVMFGMKMTVGGVLYMILAHEIHHRGELMIVMRWVGDMPVGVMGPTDEEMQAMMAAQQQG